MSRSPHSAVYFGRVRHRRHANTVHDFALRLYMVYLDLDELPELLRAGWLFSTRWWSPLRFRRADYFGAADRPLAEAVRDAVEQDLGQRPTGPVRMLTNLRCFGYVQNPVTFYYCHDAAGNLAAVLAEITNTPWGERHHYVLPAGDLPGALARGSLRGSFRKQFHVSPFQPMQQEYRWALGRPGSRLGVHMRNLQDGQCVFDATLSLQRRPFRRSSLLRALLLHPWMTAKVLLSIYWHALLLFCKRAPFYVHPRKRIAS